MVTVWLMLCGPACVGRAGPPDTVPVAGANRNENRTPNVRHSLALHRSVSPPRTGFVQQAVGANSRLLVAGHWLR